jgi:hypothetical protein
MKSQVKVENVTNGKGRAVPNQLLIQTAEGLYFQSYKSIIAFIPLEGPTVLDYRKWDYSVTTGRYRNQFLNETKKETEKKIKAGVYVLADLNR